MKKKFCALFLALLMAFPLSGCVIEGMVVVTVATLVAGIGDHYALRTNWGIQLPDGYVELYGVTEVGRDGDRYHVIRYDCSADLDALVAWNQAPCGCLKQTPKESLERMEVPLEFYPDYDNWYWFQMIDEDDSRDQLLLFRDGDTLYIYEHYM